MSFNPSSTANGEAARGTGPLKNGRPGGDPLLRAVAQTSATAHYSRPTTNQEPSSLALSFGGASPSSSRASVDAAGQAVTPGTTNSRSGSTSDITTSVTGGGSTVTTDTTTEVQPPPTMVRTTIADSAASEKIQRKDQELVEKTNGSPKSDDDGDDGDVKVGATRDEKKPSDSEDSDDGEDEETREPEMDKHVAELISNGTIPSAPAASVPTASSAGGTTTLGAASPDAAVWPGRPNRAQRIIRRENSMEKKKAPKRMGSNAGRNKTPSKKAKLEALELLSPEHAKQVISDKDKELSATKTKHSNKVKEIKWVDRMGYILATMVHESNPSINVGKEVYWRMRRSMQFEDSDKLDHDVIYALRENFEDYSKKISGEDMTVEEMDAEWEKKQDEDEDDN